MIYTFFFQQQVLGTPDKACYYLRTWIKAKTHLEAFTQWCAWAPVQDLPMNRLGTLKVEVTA